MKQILVILITLPILLLLYSLTLPNLYGNGIRNNFGIDYLPPLNVDDTPLSLHVEFKPSMTKSNNNETRSLIFKLIDFDKNIFFWTVQSEYQDHHHCQSLQAREFH